MYHFTFCSLSLNFKSFTRLALVFRSSCVTHFKCVQKFERGKMTSTFNTFFAPKVGSDSSVFLSFPTAPLILSVSHR